MIKIFKIPDNVFSLLPKVEEYLQAHPRVIFAYLFGSLAKGKINPLSDVDLAVFISREANIIEERIGIHNCLAEILNTEEIDLVILNTAPLPLRARIIENKKVIVDKAPFLRHKFESLSLREYFDFFVKERQILNRRYSLGR